MRLFLGLFTFLWCAMAFAGTLPQLTNKGLGNITVNSPYDINKVQQLFASFQVRKADFATEGMKIDTILVASPQEPLLAIFPTEEKSKKIFCLAYRTNFIRNDQGVQIGDRYRVIFPAGKPVKCLPGREEMSGQVICQAPKAAHLFYVFSGKWDGVDGVVPPVAVIENWKVQQVIWLANLAAMEEITQFCRVNPIN